MQGWERTAIARLLLQAGAIAVRHYEAPQHSLKYDGTLVTVADREIEDFFTGVLERPDQGAYLIGEETLARKTPAYVRAALKETAYIVDPIDGTAPYAYHVPTWGVSLGYCRGGVLEEGAVFCPITRELFITDGPKVYLAMASAGDQADRLTYRELTEPHPGYTPGGLVAITQEMARSGAINLPNVLHALCCAVVPLTYLLLGRYAVYFGALNLWDLAGALPMLAKRGFESVLLDGTPVTLRLDESWLYLAEDAPKRFRLRQTCCFAPPGWAARLCPKVGR